jgi:hypothetical protein
MPIRPVWVLPALVVSLGAGCGRIGVDFVHQPRSQPVDTFDAAEPEPDEPQEAGDALDASAGLDASDELDAGQVDAGAQLDASDELDAAQVEAGTPDAGGCRLGTSSGQLLVRNGEVGTLSGAYRLTLAQSGLCAAPAGCLFDHGGDVTQASCDTSPCQIWESVDQGNGWLALRNAKLGACLYMSGLSAGLSAISWECFASDRILWQAVCAGDDEWRLVSKPSNMLIGGDGSTAPDAGIVQGGQGVTAQQRWRITPTTNTFSVVMASAEGDANALWRYTTTAPTATWNQRTFDDSSWSLGAGAFGDGTRAFTPTRTSWTSADIWLRRAFSLSSVPSALSLKIFHDEQAEVYVNGVSVTTLSGWSQGYQTIDLPSAALSALIVGNNTIAVHCRNTSAPQIIDVGLGSYALP